jgi:hypothetical protein
LKKLLPLIGLIIGFAGGAVAAIFLAPPAEPTEMTEDGHTTSDGSNTSSDDHANEDGTSEASDSELVKLANQFVVPVILGERVQAMVILTVALEVEQGTSDQVHLLEPKLRDQFLAELFGLAAIGGFEDNIISRKTLDLVRKVLSEKAKSVLAQKSAQVLITDMVRQDL